MWVCEGINFEMILNLKLVTKSSHRLVTWQSRDRFSYRGQRSNLVTMIAFHITCRIQFKEYKGLVYTGCRKKLTLIYLFSPSRSISLSLSYTHTHKLSLSQLIFISLSICLSIYLFTYISIYLSIPISATFLQHPEKLVARRREFRNLWLKINLEL